MQIRYYTSLTSPLPTLQTTARITPRRIRWTVPRRLRKAILFAKLADRLQPVLISITDSLTWPYDRAFPSEIAGLEFTVEHRSKQGSLKLFYRAQNLSRVTCRRPSSDTRKECADLHAGTIIYPHIPSIRSNIPCTFV